MDKTLIIYREYLNGNKEVFRKTKFRYNALKVAYHQALSIIRILDRGNWVMQFDDDFLYAITRMDKDVDYIYTVEVIENA